MEICVLPCAHKYGSPERKYEIKGLANLDKNCVRECDCGTAVSD